MKINFKLVGTIAGIFIAGGFPAGILGAFIGFNLGSLIDKKLYESMQINSSVFPSPLSRQDLFIQTTFAIMGHIAKAKGQVTDTDLIIAQKFMDKLNLDEKKQNTARKAFNQGKTTTFPLRKALHELRQHIDNSRIIRLFLEIQLQVILTDNFLSAVEKRILFVIAEELEIPTYQIEQMIIMMQAANHFGSGDFQQRYHRDYSDSSSEQDYYKYTQGNRSYSSITDAYQILGVDSSAERQEVKRAYRKLMNENHPDKLISKGLPPEMMEVAKEKAQKIQAAYDLICKQNNWK